MPRWGVLLFDPLDARGTFLLLAIREVTTLPVTAIVYSHNHADHIADAKVFVERAAKAAVKLRIIASSATGSKQSYLKSQLPKATETISWPRGRFTFEGLTVAMQGFTRPYHTDDQSAWLLVQDRVLHSPDLLNPDQPPSGHSRDPKTPSTTRATCAKRSPLIGSISTAATAMSDRRRTSPSISSSSAI